MNEFDVPKFENLVENKIVEPLVKSLIDKKKDIHSNTLDPFSAMLDCMVTGQKFSDWKEKETSRQSQKTIQNKVGNLHEYVIDCFPDWENLQTGSLVDVVNHKKKIVAEIKNKHNTTKGNHKVAIYDDLDAALKDESYLGYQGYAVEILPKGKSVYNKYFTPSDNKTKENRPARDDIKLIDGKSFYGLISGEPDFVKDLYNKYLPAALEKAITNINKSRPEGSKLPIPKGYKNDPFFNELIEEAFS